MAVTTALYPNLKKMDLVINDTKEIMSQKLVKYGEVESFIKEQYYKDNGKNKLNASQTRFLRRTLIFIKKSYETLFE